MRPLCVRTVAHAPRLFEAFPPGGLDARVVRPVPLRELIVHHHPTPPATNGSWPNRVQVMPLPHASEMSPHWSFTRKPCTRLDVTQDTKCLVAWAMLLSSAAELCRGKLASCLFWSLAKGCGTRTEVVREGILGVVAATNRVHRFQCATALTQVREILVSGAKCAKIGPVLVQGLGRWFVCFIKLVGFQQH